MHGSPSFPRAALAPPGSSTGCPTPPPRSAPVLLLLVPPPLNTGGAFSLPHRVLLVSFVLSAMANAVRWIKDQMSRGQAINDHAVHMMVHKQSSSRSSPAYFCQRTIFSKVCRDSCSVRLDVQIWGKFLMWFQPSVSNSSNLHHSGQPAKHPPPVSRGGQLAGRCRRRSSERMCRRRWAGSPRP